MGFWGSLWGGIKSVAKKAVNAVKSVGSKIVDGVKKVATTVKDKVTNIVGKFTGKNTFEEAKRLREKISKLYDEKGKEFNTKSQGYIAEIEKHVDSINACKKKIKTQLFAELAMKLDQLCGLEYQKEFSVEKYVDKGIKLEGIRDTSELYKIDFDKHPFKTALQAIFTLGFYTRKKAQETLHEVQIEEGKVNKAIAEMEEHLAKLAAIKNAMKSVDEYFKRLIELYEVMLVRTDSSVNYLYVRCMTFAHKIVKTEMDVRRLPVVQQKELMAIITASKILNKMADTQIASLKERKPVEDYSQEMKAQHDEFKQYYEAA